MELLWVGWAVRVHTLRGRVSSFLLSGPFVSWRASCAFLLFIRLMLSSSVTHYLCNPFLRGKINKCALLLPVCRDFGRVPDHSKGVLIGYGRAPDHVLSKLLRVESMMQSMILDRIQSHWAQ
jgi:hypothetical protein